MAFTIDVEHDNKIIIFRLEGHGDVNTSYLLQQKIAEVFEKKPQKTWIFDFSCYSRYMTGHVFNNSSSGIDYSLVLVLLDVLRQTNDKNRIAIVCSRIDIERLTTNNLYIYFELFASLDEAKKAYCPIF